MNFLLKLDKGIKRVDIYIDKSEYILRCFKNDIIKPEWHYHASTKDEAIKEAYIFLNKRG